MKQTEILVCDGIFPAVNRDRYDVIERVNFSTLKWMKKCPKKYRHHSVKAPKDTPAMKMGRVSHVAALEPERFRASIAVWDGPRREGKDWDDFRLRHAGKELLTVDEHETCLAISKAIEGEPEARRYLTNGGSEVTMLWKHPVSVETSAGKFEIAEIECKGRIDFDSQDAIVDLKTTRDASPEEFGKQANSLGYFTQAAWYVDGYAFASGGIVKPYVIVAVENTEPYVVQVYELTKEDLQLGRIEYRAWLDKLAFCRAHNFWPGYSHDGKALVLQRPAWARSQDDLSDLDLEHDSQPQEQTE